MPLTYEEKLQRENEREEKKQQKLKDKQLATQQKIKEKETAKQLKEDQKLQAAKDKTQAKKLKEQEKHNKIIAYEPHSFQSKMKKQDVLNKINDQNKHKEQIQSQQSLKQNIQPIFLKTESKQFSLQVEVPTLAKTKYFANDSWESNTIIDIHAHLPFFQEQTNTPVEFRYSISDGKLIMSLSLTGPSKQLGLAIKEYMKVIVTHIPKSSENIKILIATGLSEATWEYENSWSHQHIVTPALETRYKIINAKKQKKYSETEHPEHFIIPEENAVMSYPSSKIVSNTQAEKVIHNIHVALLNIAEIPYRTEHEQVVFIPKQVKHLLHHQTTNNYSKNGLIDKEFKVFFKEYLIGTEIQKNKKIGNALELLVSSGALTHEQIKTSQQKMNQLYNNKYILEQLNKY